MTVFVTIKMKVTLKDHFQSFPGERTGMNPEIATLLYFTGGDENTSLQGWRTATRETVKIVKDTLREYASHESSLDDNDAPPLSFIYSLFSVLCILISEEYDAALVAFVENDPTPLALLLPEGTPLDDVSREAVWIVEQLRREWQHAVRNKGLKSVRELTPYEMKLRLQHRGHVLFDSKTGKQVSMLDFPGLRRAVWESIFIAIDPFTPPELAGKKVETMLREFQATQAKEIEESWQDELKAGIVGDDFPTTAAEEERLRFDFRRAFSGNKKTRGEGTTFEKWLRRLEVYEYARRGLSSREIRKKITDFKNDTCEAAAVKISQDKAQARAMIEAALSGIPVSAVANVRAARS
ncbi:MAG: hypothetical protein RW306_17200 [Geobacteraceae bacterium]|nr:hypothetical protein [Geobacteraceae bacterium]